MPRTVRAVPCDCRSLKTWRMIANLANWESFLGWYGMDATVFSSGTQCIDLALPLPPVSCEAMWAWSQVLSSVNPEARGKEYLSARRGHHQRSPPGNEFSALMTQCGGSAIVSQWRVKGTNLPLRDPSLVGSSVVVLVLPKRRRGGIVSPPPYATAGPKRAQWVAAGCWDLHKLNDISFSGTRSAPLTRAAGLSTVTKKPAARFSQSLTPSTSLQYHNGGRVFRCFYMDLTASIPAK